MCSNTDYGLFCNTEINSPLHTINVIHLDSFASAGRCIIYSSKPTGAINRHGVMLLNQEKGRNCMPFAVKNFFFLMHSGCGLQGCSK